jgi:LysR family glycine cleavage system transcriptional activator
VQITVHAPVSLAALWLAPKLPAFSAAYPAIDIRLASVIWDNAVPDEATDLEIRYGMGHWHGLSFRASAEPKYRRSLQSPGYCRRRG